MLIDILIDWRILLLLKEERFSLSEIFALFPKDLKELQVAEILGAPFFMRVDGKRWCQASVWKGGRRFRPSFSLAGKTGKKDRGQNKK